MSRRSSAIEWRTHRRLIRRSSAVSKPRASRARMVARRRRHRRRSPRGLERPVDLLGGVVVDEAQAQDAADLRLAEPLDEPGRVEVAVPDEDALPPERFGGVARGDAIDGHRHRRHALGGPSRVDHPVDGHAIDGREPVEEPAHQPLLVGHDGGHPGDEFAPPLAGIGGAWRPGDVAVRAADVAKVVGRGERARDRLRRQRCRSRIGRAPAAP